MIESSISHVRIHISATSHARAYIRYCNSCVLIEEWVAGKGKQPVTWRTLTQVLCDIELSTLAGEIEAIKINK